MRKVISFFIVSVFIISSVYPQDKVVEGSWMGKLELGAVNLRIIFNITGESPDYKVTMDSPDQGAKGIEIGPLKIENDSIIISAAMMMGEYRGEFDSPTSIKGKWTQAGRSMPLDLEKMKEEFRIKRPQEPKEPFPYSSENVVFYNKKANIELAGTLTIPPDGDKFPALVLVSGSGSQNRDEEIFGHKPFKVLADYLSRNGIVVLRYDDRGVAGSGGNPAGATSADFAGDARAAIEYLQTVDKVNKSAIGIIGHSEGALIAQIVAAKHKDIAFIISMAGQGTSGRQVLTDQVEYINRLSNVPDRANKINLATNNAIYDVMEKVEDPELGLELAVAKVAEVLKKFDEPESSLDEVKKNLKGQLSPSSYPWMKYFLESDPSEFLPDIICPVLALNGEKDCQVLYKQNLEGIKKGLQHNKDVTTISFPDLNHLFQHSGTGLVNEYGQIEETMSPEVLKTIADWIKERY